MYNMRMQAAYTYVYIYIYRSIAVVYLSILWWKALSS